MHTSKESIGKRIRETRERIPMTGMLFGNKIGVSRTKLSRYENGESWQQADILHKIAELGNVSLDWLITGKESKTAKSGEIAANIFPGNDILTKKIKEQNNRPTRISTPLRLLVQWMDEVLGGVDNSDQWFYEDIKNRYPSFKTFIEKKQTRESDKDSGMDSIQDEKQG